ncbi:IS1182 family transposase [Bacillus andreraoultii]|uniref:IS1182 family transposase n=1 Tax=Bacillus andreraoultii TaxID=1499685 RepID=UPI0009E31F91|nr:IS1182 family transposase [Bacillus andreraoultii]
MFKHYNMNQVVLPLNLEIKLKENDIAFAINDLVESIPEEAFEDFIRQTGRPAYHPRMMLKVILCGYTQSVFSGRKIEALLQDSIRMMWLAQGHEPSYRTINRFRSNPLIENILRECFVQFRNQLVEKELIEEEAIFIDGTKIEANANKFTFVWRKSIERYSDKLIEKSNQLYDELLEKEIIPAIEREKEEELSVKEMEEVVEKLDEKIEEYNKKIEVSEVGSERKKLRSERKLPIQSRKQWMDYITRKQKYQNDMEIFGDRNSYSKTDPDATFMRMKDDYMKNGQLKAGYNVQIATEGQYVLAYDVFPNPTDTRTLIPFLDTIEENFFELPEFIVADAGYGSEQNYEDIIENRNRTPLITYNQYRKEKKKKHKDNAFHVDNWEYNEDEDTFLCPNGRKVRFSHHSKRTDRYGFTREFKVYECEDCSDCPLRDLCTKAKEGNNRKVYINEKWESQKEYVRTKLSDEKTGEIYGKRKIDVEPAFGFLKANLGFTRFSVRGKQKVKNELAFALMAVNMRKVTAISGKIVTRNGKTPQKKVPSKFFIAWNLFIYYFWLVMSQPLFSSNLNLIFVIERLSVQFLLHLHVPLHKTFG